MTPLLLTGLNGGQTNQQYVITEQGLQIGRDPGNDICLDDPDVSRHHARVILYNSALWVQDTGSRNGVFVNTNRISSHKQLSPGDQVMVGSHEFRIDQRQGTGASSEPAFQVDMSLSAAASAGAEKKGMKKWPFVVAIGVVVLLIGVVGAAGGGGGGDEAVSTGGAEGAQPATGGGEYSLESALSGLEGSTAGEGGSAPGTASAGGSSTSLEDALRTITDGEAMGMEGWPDPPEDTTWQELVDQGHSLYNAGRLHDARIKYQMAAKAAVTAETSCEICMVRIEKVGQEIDFSIQENYDAGFKYYESMQYQQAIAAWETVLLLEPDEEAEIHVRTVEYLDQARSAVMRQY